MDDSSDDPTFDEADYVPGSSSGSDLEHDAPSERSEEFPPLVHRPKIRVGSSKGSKSVGVGEGEKNHAGKGEGGKSRKINRRGYLCQICYVEVKNLRKHMRKVHKITTEDAKEASRKQRVNAARPQTSTAKGALVSSHVPFRDVTSNPPVWTTTSSKATRSHKVGMNTDA